MTELSPTTCACISKALYLIKTRSIDTEDKWIDCNTLYILASNISGHHLSLNASYTQNCLNCFEWIADCGRSTFIKPVLNKVLLDPKYQGQICCLRMLFTDWNGMHLFNHRLFNGFKNQISWLFGFLLNQFEQLWPNLSIRIIAPNL